MESNTDLLGMKYPASPMMGGRRNKKKMSGVRVFGKAASSLTKKKNSPMRMPQIMRMLDSGKNLLIHVALWKPRITFTSRILLHKFSLKLVDTAGQHTYQL